MANNEHRDNEKTLQSPSQLELPILKEMRIKETKKARDGFIRLIKDIVNREIETPVEIMVPAKTENMQYGSYFKGLKFLKPQTAAFGAQLAISEVGESEPMPPYGEEGVEDMFYKVVIGKGRNTKTLRVELRVSPAEPNEMVMTTPYERVSSIFIHPCYLEKFPKTPFHHV